MSRKKDIDATDIIILNQLQQNANLTNREVANRIGLSESATLKRVRNLLRRRALLRISGHINYGYFGYSFRAVVLIQAPSQHIHAVRIVLARAEFALTAFQLRLSSTTTGATFACECIARSQWHLTWMIEKQFVNLIQEIYVTVKPIEAVLRKTDYIHLSPDDVG